MIQRSGFCVLILLISMTVFYSCASFWYITVDVYRRNNSITGEEDAVSCSDDFTILDTYSKPVSFFENKYYKSGFYYFDIDILREVPLYLVVSRANFSFPDGTSLDLLNDKRISIYIRNPDASNPLPSNSNSRLIDINGQKALVILDTDIDDKGEIYIFFDNLIIPDVPDFDVDWSITLVYQTGGEKILHLRSHFEKEKVVTNAVPST